jgi:hypothetical protein
VLDSSSEQIAGETKFPEAARDLQRRRHKRHRAQQQKRLERFRKKALTVFLYVLAIGLTLAIWYELSKG